MTTNQEPDNNNIIDESVHSHYTAIPNMVIDCCMDKSLSKHAVLLYVWYKRVCWERGECYQSLETLCKHLSMSKSTLLSAREELRNHHFIKVNKTENQYGSERVVVTIANIWIENNRHYNDQKQMVLDSTGPYSKVRPPVPQSTVYNTYTNEDKKDFMSPPSDGDVMCVPPPSRRKHLPSKWDQRAAEELNRIISSIIKVNSRADLNQWSKQFCLMREVDKIDKKLIRETIEWYAKHIGEEYCVEAFSASSFRTKFKQGKFAGAMRRSRNGDGDNTDEPEIEYEIVSV